MVNKDEQTKRHDILEKPLPQIIDEINSSVGLVETAAVDARKAADDARLAGEKAAADVMRRFRKVFLTMVEDITKELGEGEK